MTFHTAFGFNKNRIKKTQPKIAKNTEKLDRAKKTKIQIRSRYPVKYKNPGINRKIS